MTTPLRLAAFACLVALGLGGGYAVGSAVGPLDQAADVADEPTVDHAPSSTTSMAGSPESSTPTNSAPDTHDGHGS